MLSCPFMFRHYGAKIKVFESWYAQTSQVGIRLNARVSLICRYRFCCRLAIVLEACAGCHLQASWLCTCISSLSSFLLLSFSGPAMHWQCQGASQAKMKCQWLLYYPRLSFQMFSRNRPQISNMLIRLGLFWNSQGFSGHSPWPLVNHWVPGSYSSLLAKYLTTAAIWYKKTALWQFATRHEPVYGSSKDHHVSSFFQFRCKLETHSTQNKWYRTNHKVFAPKMTGNLVPLNILGGEKHYNWQYDNPFWDIPIWRWEQKRNSAFGERVDELLQGRGRQDQRPEGDPFMSHLRRFAGFR